MNDQPKADPHDDAWHRYVNTCRMGGTPAQRQFAFDHWNRLMRADCKLRARAEIRAARAVARKNAAEADKATAE